MWPTLVVHALWLEKARARKDSVACDWYCTALDYTAATWLDVLANGAWRSTADVWSHCRYMGNVQLSGPTAALWASITATVYNAITMASTITLSHNHEHDCDM